MTRIYLHTLDWNERAQKAFKKAGFTALEMVNRRGFTFLAMEILREQVDLRE